MIYYFRIDYSLLKLSTGFAVAAFIAWKLAVTHASNTALFLLLQNHYKIFCNFYSAPNFQKLFNECTKHALH